MKNKIKLGIGAVVATVIVASLAIVTGMSSTNLPYDYDDGSPKCIYCYKPNEWNQTREAYLLVGGPTIVQCLDHVYEDTVFEHPCCQDTGWIAYFTKYKNDGRSMVECTHPADLDIYDCQYCQDREYVCINAFNGLITRLYITQCPWCNTGWETWMP